MANLLDTIRQNRNQAVQPQGVTDETQKVQTLLRAKSGRAVAAQDAATSSLGEQAAIAGTNSQLAQLGQQVQLQGQQDRVAEAGQKQTERLQRQDIDQTKKFDTLENKMKTQQILNDLSKDRGSLDLEKDKARLEQASFLLSMQDKKYTDQLQDIGRRRRLDTEAGFKDEMQQLAFGDNIALLQQKLGNNDVLATSDRDFRKIMSQLSIEDAKKIADLETKYNAQDSAAALDYTKDQASQAAKARNAAAQAQGLSGIMSAGIGAYGQYADSQANTKKTGT